MSMMAEPYKSLAQQAETSGFRERALLEKVVEQSKEFDDLTARYESWQATFSLNETRVRDEFAVVNAAHTQLKVQIERSIDHDRA